MKFRIIIKRGLKKVKQIKKYKLISLFDYKDMFHSVLEFLDEIDKIQMYRTNIEFRDFVVNSKLCPIYHKFNPDFFLANILNKKIIDIYIQNAGLFQKVLTYFFLNNYCKCQSSFAKPYCNTEKINCVPCHLYNLIQYPHNSPRCLRSIVEHCNCTECKDFNIFRRYLYVPFVVTKEKVHSATPKSIHDNNFTLQLPKRHRPNPKGVTKYKKKCR
ncbi:MAG: hypothetical protein Hyperionvirus28_26 [Hyperionvirus sp.]|uniref:Uncharacterized protein n=1 Tax=Hyperionvirus sp. TaxID=2487770 RepID=A0A3G5ABD9_9VIRU|nr:MAG: hypothetical protein Hyperionvirus28_26 [Hyperionvirus sp.]